MSMASTGHTYGPSCLLHAESNTFTRRASEASVDPPPIKAHYFYCSPLPIDDPLSPVPPPPSGTAPKQKLPPRPVSVHDNARLEKAWLKFQDPGRYKSSDSHRETSENGKSKSANSGATSNVDNLAKIFNEPREDGVNKGRASIISDFAQPSDKVTEPGTPANAIKIDDTTEEEQPAIGDMKISKVCTKIDLSQQWSVIATKQNELPATKPPERAAPAEKKQNDREKKAKKSGKVAKDAEEDKTTVQTTIEPTEGLSSNIPGSYLDSNQAVATNTLKIASQGGRQMANKTTQPDLTLCDDPDHIPFDETMPVDSHEIDNDEFEGNLKKRRGRSPFRHALKREKGQPKIKSKLEVDEVSNSEAETIPYRRLSMNTQKAHDAKQKAQDARLGSSPADTTGTPFLRIPSRLRRSHSRSRSPDAQPGIPQADGEGPLATERQKPVFSRPGIQTLFSAQQTSRSQDGRALSVSAERSPEGRTGRSDHEEGHYYFRKQQKNQETHVTVGVSRLHFVEMPSLKMGPIYWDPVHDISSVVRGTWFYKETMWPVEADLANQIEEGYEYIKPWTLTYVDELNSCQEIGPEAELKLVHRIWPAEEPSTERPKSAADKVKKEMLSTDAEQLDYQGQERKNAIMMAGSPPNRAAGVLDGFDDPARLFSKCSMIYVNARDAQIMRPSQLPSVARGRKPLAAIRKGRPIGIPVVRGFEFKAWEKLYPPPKKTSTSTTQKPRANVLVRSMTNLSRQDPPCDACTSAEERPRPTDLILVIHGIGQKLSERVESFNFTHSINAFRRQVNMELEADAVTPWLRQGLGGIMVLPINWRSKIQLEEGALATDPNCRDPAETTRNEFTLKDITEESIPAVRNLISDVLLDIPYYMSHHKPKMIEAVIKEANRVYRLWCNNNPDFHETGRVHIVAHSLGSVMSLDILSKQPTKLPKQLDFKTSKIRTDMFEFDTKNLFFAGSPVGLFLYINRTPLLPRKGREKPGADGEDNRAGVTGEAGTFGCLAIDNLYNILHYIDPIAYRLNAAVDVDYAASLQAADVPSTAITWAQYFGLKSKPVMPTEATRALTGLDSFTGRPTVQAMPSTVEMETHNFTREEIAEKRMFLLNDNGQIDYRLRSGGGPLEIQYLNMLGAHSSYWILQDFVRFLVVEIGRKPGKGETVASMKATKKVRSKK